MCILLLTAHEETNLTKYCLTGAACTLSFLCTFKAAFSEALTCTSIVVTLLWASVTVSD